MSNTTPAVILLANGSWLHCKKHVATRSYGELWPSRQAHLADKALQPAQPPGQADIARVPFNQAAGANEPTMN